MQSHGVCVQGVPADDARLWWPQVGQWCEDALVYASGLLLLEDVQKAVAERDMQMWLIHQSAELKAVCITQIHVFPRAKVLEVIILGGSGMDGWLPDLLDVLEKFAAAHGCKAVNAYGRRGWINVLRPHGWRDSVVMISKEVT